jgi:hypothetical protein
MCESTDIVNQTMCKLLLYAREQWRWNGRNRLLYPIDPQAMKYWRRPDLEKWEIVPK